jgi:putative oxidoreductase
MKTEVPPATLRSVRFRRWAALPLRIAIGYGFLAHGVAKLMRGPEHFFATLGGLGVPLPHLAGWLTILLEVVGGAALLLGAFMLIISVPLMATMLVAIFTVHLPFGFSSIKLQAVTAAGPQFGPPGYEVCVLYLAGLVTLVLAGAGPWSVDEWRSARRIAAALPAAKGISPVP